MDRMDLYRSLPVPLQNFSLSAYGLILQQRYYGDGYANWCALFDRQESWSRSQMEQWQLTEAQRIIELASGHVPHYRDAFRKAGVGPRTLQGLVDIRKFPFLEKESIRRDYQSLLDERRDSSRLLKDRTSGSTGTPLVMCWSREMFPKWWALHERRVRNWAGVSQAMPRAMVGGRPIVAGNSQGPYYRYNYLWKQLYMSSYHISPATAPGYVEAMVKHGSQWITGYGSAIALLGEWLRENPVPDLRVRAALTSGDDLLPSRRMAIQEGFGCRVFDNYGSTEGCMVISECEHGGMHVQPESGILEIVNEHGQACAPGEVGEMIVTGLLNDAMPLIRYRTGDLGAWATESECSCGRHSPLVSQIEGRADDYLVLPDGRRVGRLSTAIKKALSIRSAQIVQDVPDHAWLLVVAGPGYKPQHGQVVRDDILSRVGAFSLDIREVDLIPKTPVGKQRLVIRLFDRPDIVGLYHLQLPDLPWRC